MVNKSVVSQNCPLASGVSTDRSVTVAVAAAPMKVKMKLPLALDQVCLLLERTL